MAGYYDVVLMLIPLSMLAVTGVLVAAGMELTTSVPLASLVSVGLMGHAMFVRAPVDPAPPAAKPAQAPEGPRAD